MIRNVLVTLWAITAICSLQAAFEPSYEGTLHEAYMPKDFGPVIFQAVPEAPPAPVAETPPEFTKQGASWIPGYWAWSEESKDFLWITGVWRVPPPGMHWISGKWKEDEKAGWFWQKGFWSSSEKKLSEMIEKQPPDPIPENPGFPESANYFWNPGQWVFNESTHDYEWLGGSWVLFDPEWILAPAHYVWYEGGYQFIPSYWDWSVGERGKPYLAVFVPKVNRSEKFDPVIVLDEGHLYQALIAYYPDYLYVCQHINHYHPDHWSTIAPTWWQWLSWWSLPWHDQWALWWWFTHPGYPQPQTLSSDVTERIRNANPRLLQLMNEARAPFIVTPKGVVPPSYVFKILNQDSSGKNQLPIMPAGQKEIQKIKEEAGKLIKLPESPTKLGEEIEPSRRGKLHGLRETLPKEAFLPVEQDPQAKKSPLPKKPSLELTKAEDGEGDKEVSQQIIRAQTADFPLVPAEDLKRARKSANSASKPRSKEQISSPPTGNKF